MTKKPNSPSREPRFVLLPLAEVVGPLPIDFADLHAETQIAPKGTGRVTWDDAGEWPRPDVSEPDEASTDKDLP